MLTPIANEFTNFIVHDLRAKGTLVKKAPATDVRTNATAEASYDRAWSFVL